jgi:hypothetical protein
VRSVLGKLLKHASRAALTAKTSRTASRLTNVNDAKVETFPQSYQASTSASTTTVFRPSPRLKILNLSLQDRFAVFPCFTAPVDALAQRPADFVDVVAPAVGAVAAMGGLGRARGLLGQPVNGSSSLRGSLRSSPRSRPRSLKLPTVDIPEAVVLFFLTPLSAKRARESGGRGRRERRLLDL